MLKMQRAARTKERARIISFWKGSLDGNEGEEKPTIGCGSIVKERNESGPAAPQQKHRESDGLWMCCLLNLRTNGGQVKRRV